MLDTMSDQQHTIPSGSPIWIDLVTGGFARQQEFYEALFGWTFEDQGEEFGHYRMIRAASTWGSGSPASSAVTTCRWRRGPPCGSR